MRKILLATFLTLISGFSLLAQTDTKAKAILAEVSRKYRSYEIIKADFAYTLDNPQANLKETHSGILYARPKTNKYRVVFKEQELISDGKNQWSYLKADKEVQLSEVEKGADALNPANIFTFYEKGFKYLYTGESKLNGKVYQGIELVPLDGKKNYFKIRLSIDKLNKQITNAVFFDKNGNRYTYVIKNFVPNVKVPESTFAFDASKYPGVEVVDLR
ncbi:MAG TPA: outer membrane lipoprotein carrier protein LolA [Daejeonella sp.]|nr:outer membrane lipoprotein carrier protein LolA [Daejeonella sp.]